MEGQSEREYVGAKFRAATKANNLEVLAELQDTDGSLTLDELQSRVNGVEDGFTALEKQELVVTWTGENGRHIELSGHGLGVLRALDHFLDLKEQAADHFR